jgi:membrane associated rhomboid family serine protease
MILRHIHGTLVLVGIVLIIGALFFLMPSLIEQFGLNAGWLGFPFRAYTLLTYSLLAGALVPWLLNLVSLFCSGLLVEPGLGARAVWLSALAGSVAGGTTFLSMSPHGVLVGSSQIAWGLSGAALVIGIREWNVQSWLARLYVIWVFITFALTIVDLLGAESRVIDFTDVAAGASGVWVACLTSMLRGQRPNNRLKQTARGRSVAESLRRTRAAA